MVAPFERMKPIMNPSVEGPASLDEEMDTEREAQRVGSVDAEMKTDEMQPRSEAVAEGVLVEDAAYKAGEATPTVLKRPQPAAAHATDAKRIADVKNKIGEVDANQSNASAAETKLAEDRRRFEVLTRNVAEAKAKVSELSKGNFVVRAWNTLMRREQEARLARAEQQLAEVTARHPEFAKPKLTLVPPLAEQRTKTPEVKSIRIFTVKEQQVMTRYTGLLKTLARMERIIPLMESGQMDAIGLDYERKQLAALKVELDTTYSQNKAFLDSLAPQEMETEKFQNRA